MSGTIEYISWWILQTSYQKHFTFSSKNCECHLYSLQTIIDPADINTLYPVNLTSRLCQDLSSKSCWIQRTQLAIYNSLNRAKKDLTHPIWSTLTRWYTPKQFHLCAAVSCALNNLREKTTRSINKLKHIYLNGIFDCAKSFALFLELLQIDKWHRIGWHTLKSYNQFGDGWHKELITVVPYYLRHWQVEYVSFNSF